MVTLPQIRLRRKLRQVGPDLINGVIAVPIMVVMMLIASRPAIMGANVIGPRLRVLGWMATTAMAATVVAMLVTL